jgi:hypothetical protein
MFRTRDFLLLFSAIVLLVVAIGVTVLWQRGQSVEQTALVKFAETPEQEYSAEIVEKKPLSREERLKEMRAKVAEHGELAVIEEPVVPEEAVAVAGEEEGAESVAAPELRCPQYTSSALAWSPQGVLFEVVEGARMVYREVVTLVGTSSVTTREVLAQLPAAPAYVGTTCLANDVVGIAQDGSLIRNNEVGLYSVFGEHTLIGYALDGFPIYGTSGVATDACGGTTAAGGYRYYLSEEREMVLNCFSGTPITL